MRSVAGQVFVFQAVLVVLLVVAASVALFLEARTAGRRDAAHRSLAAAESFAHAPGLVAALRSPDPTAELQPLTVRAGRAAGVDFLDVMNTDGVRYTDPLPHLIGKRSSGDIARAAAGEAFTEVYQGTPSDAVRAIVPVKDSHGSVVGLVSSGINIANVSGVVNGQMPVLLGAAAVALVLATGGSALVSRRLRRQTHGLGPAEMTRMYDHHDAVLHAVKEGVLILGPDRRLLLANDEARRLLGLPPESEQRHVSELGLSPRTAGLLASGRVATDEVHPAGERLLAINVRGTRPEAGTAGTVATLRDTTELAALTGRAEAARGRLAFLYEAGVRIGTTLDVVRTAEELAQVATGSFADFVTVDLVDPVLEGEEPTDTGAALRRAAISGMRADHPLFPAGDVIRFSPASSSATALSREEAVLEPALTESAWHQADPEAIRSILEYGMHSLITVPLRARGVVLGLATFWRADDPRPFDEEDSSFAEELTARAAISVDNARRYTHEHALAVTLQRSLLPRVLPEQSALEVAYRYLPARAGVGGDWFDIIPLPGARVALVVGDVVGHGLHAAATMGRLRTAVHNFSSLDLPPDELLSHLDELVDRIDQEERARDGAGITGATCLYAIYDPVSGNCTMARAGHPGPALVLPDGSVEFPDAPAGLPLGLCIRPFESTDVQLPEGSRLVLFTDGLIEDRHRDIDTGLDLLARTLGSSGGSPEEICARVLESVLPPRPVDDVALLVARTRRLAAERIAEWDVPADPAAVARVRSEASRQLTTWGLEDLSFTAELILSELITNAIRYGAEPIRVRLLYNSRLICEVSDGSSTSPHLRYAATTDEGGRGLFLISQLAERWGTRYTPRGKIIWTEQSLTAQQPEAVMPVPGLEDLL
ncbi:SpoIIE family protein phosphatase [Streptomyces sp. NPDC051320]|uniref:SpoIIE family protein phosphatase n=1 Tax=Streptomyces sp. NPDC051320 TaxID=3154644 RepID=UPI00342BA529